MISNEEISKTVDKGKCDYEPMNEEDGWLFDIGINDEENNKMNGNRKK